MRILVVEDDPSIGYVLEMLLSHQNYAVELASDGLAALELAEAFEYDLILLDVMLPKLDGISLCRRLRTQGLQMPILLLTGRNSGHDKAVGLDAGADDYVVKPFDPEELTARVRALLRRGEGSGQPILVWRGLALNPPACEVTYQNQVLPLTPKEYSLLELLLRHPNRVFSCDMILEHLWAAGEAPGEEAVRTHVKGLRQKLKAAQVATDLIETVYGLGYRLRPIPKASSLAKAEALESVIKTEPVAQQTKGAIANLWEKGLPRLTQQLEQLEAAALTLATDPAEKEQRTQAAHTAHTLIGSLAILSLSTGSQIAQRLENLLQGEQPLAPDQLVHLHQDIDTLRQVIRQHGILPPTGPSGLDSAPESMVVDAVLGEVVDETPPPPPPTATVLIVDDSPELLELLGILLEPWGLCVHSLNDPRHIWPQLEAINPDLLILDIKMPHINGIELCQQLRQHPRWRQMPILFLTGHTGAEMADRVFAAGADDLVSKPFTAPELVIRILNRLERVRLQRQP